METLNENGSLYSVAVSLHVADKKEVQLLEQAQIVEKRLGPFLQRGGLLGFFDSRSFPVQPELPTAFGNTLHGS